MSVWAWKCQNWLMKASSDQHSMRTCSKTAEMMAALNDRPERKAVWKDCHQRLPK